jgi:hypothetical protein
LVQGITTGDTNNYGVYIGTASGGATNNYSLWVTGGKVYFGETATNAVTIKTAQVVMGDSTDRDTAFVYLQSTATDILPSFNYKGADAASSSFEFTRPIRIITPQVAKWVMGRSEEEITLSTSGLTTNSAANLLPANSIIESVCCRITQAITVTTNWAVGDPTTAARFSSANATLALGTTSVGMDHWSGAVTTLAAGPSQAAAATVRITCTGSNPGAGKIRVAVFYRTLSAPTA